MESDPGSSKWKPVYTRLMAVLQNLQAQVDAERQSVDDMNEFYRLFNSVAATAEETKENQPSAPQMDVAQAKQKLRDSLEKTDTLLVTASSLRQSERPQVMTRTAGTKQGASSRRSLSVVTARNVPIRDQSRSASESRNPKQCRQPSPSKKSDEIVHREMLSSPEVQAQLREFSALVDEARRCSAKYAECPERARFLALYGPEGSAADGKSSKSELSPVLTSQTFPSREVLRREFEAYIEKKSASLDKFIQDFCAESILPLLESTTCPNLDKEDAAVLQTFYGIICNKGRRLPAFLQSHQ